MWLRSSSAVEQFSGGRTSAWDFPLNSGTNESTSGDVLLLLLPSLS